MRVSSVERQEQEVDISVAYDIATLLNNAAIAVLGTNLGVNSFLDKGNNEVAIFEYAGQPDTATHGGTVALEHPRVQVQVRDTSGLAGWNRAYQIYTFLRGQMDVSVNAHFYQYIESASFPHILNRDELNRVVYICELEAHRRPE